jgi:hypothetical protein
LCGGAKIAMHWSPFNAGAADVAHAIASSDASRDALTLCRVDDGHEPQADDTAAIKDGALMERRAELEQGGVAACTHLLVVLRRGLFPSAEGSLITAMARHAIAASKPVLAVVVPAATEENVEEVSGRFVQELLDQLPAEWVHADLLEPGHLSVHVWHAKEFAACTCDEILLAAHQSIAPSYEEARVGGRLHHLARRVQLQLLGERMAAKLLRLRDEDTQKSAIVELTSPGQHDAQASANGQSAVARQRARTAIESV